MFNITRSGMSIAAFSLLMLVSISGAQEPSEPENVERNLNLSYAGEILATRSGAAVSLRDLDGRMAQLPEDRRAGAVGAPERVAGILNGVLLTQYLANSAIGEGLLDDPQVKSEIHLAAMEILARHERDRYVDERLLDDYTAQAREVYLRDPEIYRQPEKVSFTHLLLRADSAESDDEEAEKKAKALLERARGGEAVSDLALKYSEDPSIQNNGGYFREVNVADLEAAFSSGIENLDQGDIALIQSSYGFHVLELHERTPARLQPFEEVADQLREKARAEHAKEIFESYAERFYEGELQLRDGAVAKIVERYANSNLK